MKKLNKKRIMILIILIILIIIEIIAFQFSKAKDVKKITVTISDYSKLIEDETCVLEAKNEGDRGYVLILPDAINEKIVLQYYIEEKQIESKTTTEDKEVDSQSNKIENNVNIENIVTNKIKEEVNKTTTTQNDVIEQQIGNNIYLTQEEINSAKLEIKAQYDTKSSKNNILYNKSVTSTVTEKEDKQTKNENEIKSENETKIENNEVNSLNENNQNDKEQNNEKVVTIEGYMPLDASIIVKKVKLSDIENSTKEYSSGGVSVKEAYDIKILSNGKEYEPTDFDENVKVTISGIEKNTHKYRVLHIIDNEKTEEIEKVDSEENKIIFSTGQFSVYAVLLDENIEKIEENDLNVSTMSETESEPMPLVNNQMEIISVSADEWDGKTIALNFAYGDGSSSNPYLITSAAELAYLAQSVNNGTTFEGIFFQLITDIDLKSKAWTPIGNNENSFRGVFDGGGHAIFNVDITTSSTLPTAIMAYGFFGSIGGAGATQAIVKNVEFNSANIKITPNGNATSDTGGMIVGIVTGKLYKNSKIGNVIVKNSSIQDTGTMQIRTKEFQVFVGGIAGMATNTTTSETDPGSKNRYTIENCYSNVNISLDVTLKSGQKQYSCQYAAGGIIGIIRSQPVWPTNCLFKGTLNATNGNTGPIFGQLRKNTDYTDSNNLNTLWNGNDAGNLTMTSYYTSYSTNSKTTTSTCINGDTPTSTSYRKSTSSSTSGYTQGMNKGIYTNYQSPRLSSFNDFQTTENYTKWEYKNDTFCLIPRIITEVDNSQYPTYKLQITNNYNTNPTYEYKWFVDGQLRGDVTGDSITQAGSIEKEYNIKVLIHDGQYYSLIGFKIPKLEIHIEFNIDETNNRVTATLAGTAIDYVNISDYTYQWYKTDSASDERTDDIINGATSNVLTNLTKITDYKLIAKNNVTEYEQLVTIMGTITYGERTVIYVNNVDGNNSNNGLTPETAVRNMPTAYSKLSATGTRESNFVVIMGEYSADDYIHNMSDSNKNNFSKAATITGKYSGEDYNARLFFVGNSDDNGGKGGRFLYADTTFQYLTFFANVNAGGTGRTNIYCQGHSLTIGEQVYRDRYATTTNSNAIVPNVSAPDFHLLGGFANLNTTELDANNGTIIIKSGCFARVIAGSRNTVVNSNIKNTTGTKENPFNMKIIVDIQNSTKGNIKYDINLLVAGQTDGNIYCNMEFEIKGGSIGRATGGSIGYNRAISNYPSNSYFGSSKVTVQGGAIDELYGGSLGREKSDVYYYGNIDIKITGGTINNTLYGAGAGGVTGYSENSTDPYKSYGKDYTTSINIDISGGTINGNVYGAGYGYSAYLNASQIATDGGTLYGDSTINITGGTIIGNVYGAGYGYSGYSGKTNLAQMYGKSTVNISGSPKINGDLYGAGEGIKNYAETAKMIGTSNVNVNTDLTINVYGGGNISQIEGTTNVTIKSGTQSEEVYGGGNVGIVNGTTNVYLQGGTTANVYGGGKSTDVTTTNIYLQGGSVTNIFGGSNTTGTVTDSNINTISGTANTIYGGNNAGGATITSHVNINGASIAAVYGGGNEANATTSNITLTKSENNLPEVYGGGKSADVTNTNVNCNGVTALNIFGGSNTTGTVDSSNININSGNLTNVYGGNNAGGKTNNTYIYVNGGTSENIFGGGNQAITGISNVYTKPNSNITNVYGGGNDAGVTTSNVNLHDGTIKKVYGGSNKSGTVEMTNVKAIQNEEDIKANMEVTYTARESYWYEQWFNGYDESVITVTVKITNNSNKALEKYNASITFPESNIIANNTNINIVENNGTYTFDETNRWYGINAINPGETYSFELTLNSKQILSNISETHTFIPKNTDGSIMSSSDLTVDQIFGGNNQGGITANSNVNISLGKIESVFGGNNAGGETTTSYVTTNGGTVANVYGGNNAGGITKTSNVIINGGNITDVYGGGDKAATTLANTQINAEVQHCVYGGGNQAEVETNTNVNLNEATVLDNVYGGGNEGIVNQDTNVHVYNSKLSNSLYAGGNGATAIVFGNTNLIMDGTSNEVEKNVFGGGNKAATGTELISKSTSNVNIVNGKIGGNVYGAANTSVVYGLANIKIGYDAVNDSALTLGDIQITGTVFGGGEANESGSEVYDFSFISVTDGINMDINANGHTIFDIGGSIFGSGNASSTRGASYINLKNYGKIDAPQKNVSIQRATCVILDNSAIALSGATDRTNEYSSTFFTLSRNDEVKLKNNSTLYLNCGANLLKKFSSLVDVNGQEVKAQVTVDSETGATTRNVDNRIYMAEGKNLNIATNEQVTAYGEVYGMTFFGIFTNTNNPATSTGIYNHNYENAEEITNAGTFISNSYVIGQHSIKHDTALDGFYSNYDEDGYIKTKYIEVTPEDDVYYIWLVGEELDVTTFEIGLTASKYATLGTYELGLTGFATPNTKFSLIGFSAGLSNGMSLVQPSTILNVEPDETKANSIYGLAMRSGNNGWQTKSSTTFLTADGGGYTGASTYNSDNSTYTPALNFCFYHSENLSKKQDVGTVKIRFQVQTPIDDLNYALSYIDINVTLTSALYQNDFYEAAITPGEEFGLFTTTETNITDESIFSTYYSLFIDNFSSSNYYSNYANYKHVLVSKDSSGMPYVFPENTKLTMLDMITNKYYYYVVTKDDEIKQKYVYNIKDFVSMGSNGEYFDELNATKTYYNSSKDLIYENFIFHIDLGEAEIKNDLINNTMLMELRDQDEQILLGVLGIQRDLMRYSVYKDKEAKIKVTAQTNTDTLYLGNTLDLNVTTDFTQNIVNSKTIYDTKFFNEKMGIKITVIDNNGNQLNSDSLLGINFILDKKIYYPRFDGSIRINIAEKISNVLSRIKVVTKNNTTLATGTYTIRIESFGSPDGICYGATSSDTVNLKIIIINSVFGLKVYSGNEKKIVDSKTGLLNGGENNILKTQIEYSSGLNNPNIMMCLYRRKYEDIYSKEYELVNLEDYVTDSLIKTNIDKHYFFTERNPSATMLSFLHLKTDLITGTYKLVFELYDQLNYIGEAYEYIIIK